MKDDKQITWSPEKRKLAELKEYDKNPRKISPEALERAKESIKARGFHGVFKIDTEDVILSGNQAKRVLMELGYDEVNVLVPSRELTDTEKKVILVESNKHWADWDFESLSLNFSVAELQLAGFQEHELNFMNPEEEAVVDQDKLTKSLDTFLEGNIKQIVLFFKSADYQDIIDRLGNLMGHMEVEDNTAVFIKMLEFYEAHNKIEPKDDDEEIDTEKEGD